MRSALIQHHYRFGSRMPDLVWMNFRPQKPEEDLREIYSLLSLRPPEEPGAPCLIDDQVAFERRLSSP